MIQSILSFKLEHAKEECIDEMEIRSHLCQNQAFLLCWAMLKHDSYDEVEIAEIINQFGPAESAADKFFVEWVDYKGHWQERDTSLMELIFEWKSMPLLEAVMETNDTVLKNISAEERKYIGLDDRFLSLIASKGNVFVLEVIDQMGEKWFTGDLFYHAHGQKWEIGREIFERMLQWASKSSLKRIYRNRKSKYPSEWVFEVEKELKRRANLRHSKE
jgi:hypothetical protein